MTDYQSNLEHYSFITLDPDDDMRHVPELDLATSTDVLVACQSYLHQSELKFDELLTHKFRARDICRIRSHVIDRLVISLFNHFVAQDDADGCEHTDISVVATGGYGRQEMALHSDIDLLFLYNRKDAVVVETVTKKILYVLWDLKLEVGYAVRNPDQCKKIMRDDDTVLTAALDARFLSGNRGHFEAMARLRQNLLADVGLRDRVLDRKLAERDERLKKAGSSVYLCEPNIKEGDGSLRDLQLIRWMAQLTGVPATFETLPQYDLCDQEMSDTLSFAFDFFLHVRNELHFLARKKSDQMTFPHQEYIAGRLGFVGHNGILPVERFMQTYYSVAAQVSQLTRVLIRRILRKKKGFFGRLSERFNIKKLDAHFHLFEGFVTAKSKSVFTEDPINLMKLFEWVQSTGLPISEETKDHVIACLPLVTDSFRESKEVTDRFKKIMGQYKNLGHTLFAMHEVRFFDAIIPEFRKVRNRVQHDVYHVYTVDTHSIFAVNELSRLLDDTAYVEKFPVYRKAMLACERPDLLTFGLLFHDIGKGEGGNHSVVGAKIANVVTSRMGFSEDDQKTVEFLVISHLLMPHLSQRRDLEDPQLIDNFALSMKNVDNLNMLYVLTWADIRAVGPEAWTDWKGTLLTQLYDKTQMVISSAQSSEEQVVKRIKDIRNAIVDRTKGQIADAEHFEKFLQMISPRYVLAHSDQQILEHFQLLESNPDKNFLVTEREIGQGISEVLLYTLNGPRVLSLVTGVMLAMGINILAMEIFRLSNGYLFLKLRVQTETRQSLHQSTLVNKLVENLTQVFMGHVKVDELIAKRQRPVFLMKKPVQKAETKIHIDNDVSAYYTVIDVYTHDRLGLLYDIVKTLAQYGCYVEVSKISTKVEQVVDSFYVKDIFGHKIISKDKLGEIKKALLLVVQPKDDLPMPNFEIII